MASNSVAFKDWATSESVCLSAPIDQLKGFRVGIDGDDYVHTLLFAGGGEPLLSALGGLPFSLYKRVEEDLRSFREAGIDPYFVFNGLELACKDSASTLREARKADSTLKGAWSVYDEGNGEDAVKAFGRVSLYRSGRIVRNLQAYLHRQGVNTQTAPYSAAAQLVYMQDKDRLDGVAGSASCLVFGADKVITRFEWNNRIFTWIDLSKCLQKMGLTREQFIDVCLLSGSSILPTFPEIDTDSPMSRIPAARSLMARVGLDAHSLLHDLKDGIYRDLFHKARTTIKHHVIMTPEGKVEPIAWETGPSDVHVFVGEQLPEEIYAYLSYGLVGARVLNWRTRKEVLETPPLDGGDSDAYKKLVQEKLRPLRARAVALITASLHRYYQKSDVGLKCWWNEATKTPLNIVDEIEASKAADRWHVKSEFLPSTLDSSSSPLLYAVTVLGNDATAKKTITPRVANTLPQLRDQGDLRANTVWRFLEDRGYISSDHTLSAWGKALKVSLDRAVKAGLPDRGIADGEVEEAIFLAFELLRLDVLNSKLMFPFPPYTGAPMRGSDSDKANTMLVSRVACLGAFHHAAIGYTGPLSRHLLAYHQMAAAVRGALRDLVEMHACNMLLSGAGDRRMGKKEYSSLGANLPFLNEPDIGLGLVVKSHLDELSRLPADRTDVAKWFNHALDIEGDLEKAWEMWDAINAGVQSAENNVIAAETKKIFKDTDEWLTQKRKESKEWLAQKSSEEAAPNGTA